LNSVVLLAARVIYLFIDSYYFYLSAQKNKTFNKHLTSKLQFSPNFTLNRFADGNYPEKYDVDGFLIFEWTLIMYVYVCRFLWICKFDFRQLILVALQFLLFIFFQNTN
jgi:hypothetical protein